MGSCETMERAIDETHDRIDELFRRTCEDHDVLVDLLSNIYPDDIDVRLSR